MSWEKESDEGVTWFTDLTGEETDGLVKRRHSNSHDL